MARNIVHEKMFDKGFRARLINNPKATMQELAVGNVVDHTLDYKAMVSTKDTFYFVIPYISEEQNIDDLTNIQAAGGAGNAVSSVVTVGSVGTLSTATSTAACVGSVGTLSSASSVNTDGI